MSQQFRVLMVEDNASDAELVVRELNRAEMRCNAHRVETAVEFRRELGEFQPHVILSDFSMPKFDGLEALAIAKRSHPDIPFIFVSGTIGEENAVRALQSGAVDYVLKGNLLRLPPAIERAMREIRERRARQVLGHCKKLFPAKGFWSIPQDPRAQRGPASCRQAAARQQIG